VTLLRYDEIVSKHLPATNKWPILHIKELLLEKLKEVKWEDSRIIFIRRTE
jgi:hypothetical protein